MSKFSIKELWNERYGNQESVLDYAGRLMLKSACGNPNSSFHPTIDHIRPIALGGTDTKKNIVICHCKTNEEKSYHFPHWTANEEHFHARKCKGDQKGYTIVKER